MNTLSTQTWRRWIPRIGNTHTDSIDRKTLGALSALLILVQVPHLLHMPAWVSALGFLLIGARIALYRYPHQRILLALLSPIAVTLMATCSAFIIKWQYGYFIGRDPCVAFLFILVAAKFAEIRRTPDATLLLCLSAFLLLTQYFYSQTIISAVLTLPAVFALAYSLSVLQDTQHKQRKPDQFKLIGVLFAQGLPIAALLFVVFPRLPGPLWSLPEDASATTGLSDSMSPGTIGSLSQSAAVAFRVEFDGKVPASHELYWRGPVLTEFDGRSWELSKFNRIARPDYTGPIDNVIDYTITLQPHHRSWLFALDTAASLPRSYNASQNANQQNSRPLGRMLDDGQIVSKDPVTQALRYRQSSVPGSTLPALGEPRKDTKELPGLNTRTAAFAKKLRSQHQSDSAYAAAVMQHFNEQPFSYTLQPQILGHAPVDEFMFDTQEGFCEHYAAAFVVMMRAVGIPSRVVTGYQGGQMNDDYMIVRQSDAHAWAEAYLNGAWQRFDPTQSVAPSRIENGLAAALPEEASVPRLARHTPGFIQDMQLRWDAMNHHWQRLVIDFDNDSQDSLWERTGLGKPALWQLTLLVIVFAGIWSLFVLRSNKQSAKTLSAQERYWLQLSQTLQSRKLSRYTHESQGDFLERAAQRWPVHTERFQQLDKAFTRLRFQKAGQADQSLLKETRKGVRYLQLLLPVTRSAKTSQ